MLLHVQQKMIYELRTYQVVSGKMAELNARFREVTTGLFEKHGIIIIGFWETAIGDATTTELIYMLAFDNLAHYERAWKAYIDHHQRQEDKLLPESDGPLVNIAGSKILEPTDYSPLQ